MTLNKARILSSENDASVKTEQTTNVNIKLHTPQPSQEMFNLKGQQMPGMNNSISGEQIGHTVNGAAYPSVAARGVPLHVPIEDPAYPPSNEQMYQLGRSPSAAEAASRDIELLENIDDLEKKNKFLQLLVEVYESNPIRINSYLICKSHLLMDMIKLLTDCEKVDLILDDDIACVGCCSQSKYIYVSKILVTKNGKSEDLKYCYNDVYSQFVKHGISLKIVV